MLITTWFFLPASAIVYFWIEIQTCKLAIRHFVPRCSEGNSAVTSQIQGRRWRLAFEVRAQTPSLNSLLSRSHSFGRLVGCGWGVLRRNTFYWDVLISSWNRAEWGWRVWLCTGWERNWKRGHPRFRNGNFPQQTLCFQLTWRWILILTEKITRQT